MEERGSMSRNLKRKRKNSGNMERGWKICISCHYPKGQHRICQAAKQQHLLNATGKYKKKLQLTPQAEQRFGHSMWGHSGGLRRTRGQAFPRRSQVFWI